MILFQLLSIEFCHRYTSIVFGSIYQSEALLRCYTNWLKTRLNAQDVVNAYLHFDSMSQHDYNFFCILCGYHPTTLIMDLNKRVSFACDKLQLELLEEYDQNDADYVDCECFWEMVELAMLMRGGPCCTVPEFEVQTQLLSCSPFLERITLKMTCC